jgi:hypothetical protein
VERFVLEDQAFHPLRSTIVMGMKRCGRCDLYTKIDPVDPLIIDLRVNTLTSDAQRDRDTVVAMRTLVFTTLQRVQRTVHCGQDIGAPA